MSIKDIGYLDFYGEKCVYIQEDMNYVLVPVNEGANIQRHFMEENYLLTYSSRIDKHCIVSVKRQIGSSLNSIYLSLNYIYKSLKDEIVNGFVMVGNEIDEFFSPLEHYFRLKRQDKYQSSDLLYGQDVVAQYHFTCENIPVQIDLVYGNVLRDGIRTDLTIHPQLIVTFEGTKNTDFIFHVYSTIVRFLQVVHRKTSYNLKNLQLFQNTESGISFVGFMFDSLYNRDYRASSRIDASFIYYGKKIGKLLSIIAAEDAFPIKHLSSIGNNVYEYSAERLGAVSAAFEYEYGKSSTYPQKSNLSCPEGKQSILDYIDQLQSEEPDIEQFKELAKNNIRNLGTQPGLKTKILNACNANVPALESSLSFLLARHKSVEKAATCFVNLRGKVLHKETGYIFNDSETESIRFVEIVQYVMLLKRAEYTDQEIELLLGPLYYCNDVYMKRLLSDTATEE